MNVLPNAESVFTEDYWIPIPLETEYEQTTKVGRLYEAQLGAYPLLRPKVDKEEKAGAEEVLFLAVNQIVAGEPTERIKDGEVIGTEADLQYALPGAVIVIDTEHLSLHNKPGNKNSRTTMQDESEISMGAIACLLSGMGSTNFRNPDKNYPVLGSYSKKYDEPEIGIYQRDVDVYTFCLGTKGETVGLGMLQWRNDPRNPYATTLYGRLLKNMYEARPSVVGETLNETIVGVSTPTVSRIREAHLCIAGTRAVAPAKARQRRLLIPKTQQVLSH